MCYVNVLRQVRLGTNSFEHNSRTSDADVHPPREESHVV